MRTQYAHKRSKTLPYPRRTAGRKGHSRAGHCDEIFCLNFLEDTYERSVLNPRSLRAVCDSSPKRDGALNSAHFANETLEETRLWGD